MTVPSPIRIGLAPVNGCGAAGCTLGPDYKRPEVPSATRDRLTAEVQAYKAPGGGWELPPAPGEAEAR